MSFPRAAFRNGAWGLHMRGMRQALLPSSCEGALQTPPGRQRNLEEAMRGRTPHLLTSLHSRRTSKRARGRSRGVSMGAPYGCLLISSR